MSNSERINEDIIKAILENKKMVFKFNIIKKLEDKILYSNDVKEITTFEDMFSDLLYGNTILLIEGQNIALSIDTCLLYTSISLFKLKISKFSVLKFSKHLVRRDSIWTSSSLLIGTS